MMQANSRIDTDRYGVPQYNGDPEFFEEYEERAWDLFHGREGNPQTQVATPVHLRSGLSGPAYESVRKLSHGDLKTKDDKGEATLVGMKLLLSTLKENIAHEAPVKTNELFFNAFYSPQVWRLQTESMQQYIVRREQDFKRLEEVLTGTGQVIPEHIRAMMLLAFGGLDQKEQLNVLSSVNNEYNFKKISQALRIQYPNCTGRPVMRRDYLGCGRQPAAAPLLGKTRPKPFAARYKGKGKQQAFAAETEEDEDQDYEDEAFYEEEDQAEGAEEPDSPDYTDDGLLDVMLQEYDMVEDPALADALATIMQKKKTSPGAQKGQPGPGQSFPFKAKGEMSFDRARESRKSAVKFLKTVTPCTSCGQRGHWQGDDECPNRKRTGKGQGSPKKAQKPHAKKKATNFFVLHGDLEDKDSEAEAYMVLRDTDLCEHSSYFGGNEKKFMRSANGHSRQIMCKEDTCNKAVIRASRSEPRQLWSYLVQIALTTIWGRRARARTTYQMCCEAKDHFMAAKLEQDKAGETKRERERAVEAQRQERVHAGGAGYLGPHPLQDQPEPPYNPDMHGWSVVSPPRPIARIVRMERQEVKAWIYAVCVSPNDPLPPFPALGAEDQDVLIPLPCDAHLLGNLTPYPGRSFEDAASSADSAWYCAQVLNHALSNQPMQPEVYRFAFYLHGRLQLVKQAIESAHAQGSDATAPKRALDPNNMVTKRQIRVPVAMDPQRLDVVTEQDCDVMMATADNPEDAVEKEGPEDDCEIPSSYVTSKDDPPGLAILDSGCTKTMHGRGWARDFERELEKIGLPHKIKAHTQVFKGVGGQITSEIAKVYPIGLAKAHGEMQSSETDGPVPLFLSRPFMEELGTVLNLGRRTVSFTKLGVTDLPLIKTSRGHLAVSILDFDLENLSQFFPEESYAAEVETEGGRTMTQEEIDAILAGYSEDYDIPEGWNPDDWHDHRFHLEIMRQDVEEWSAAREATVEEGDPQGDVSEDVHFFETVVRENKHCKRKASNKKEKKFTAMAAAVDGDDFEHRRVLSGESKVNRTPPYGKTWLKQILSGQVTTTMLCVLAGMAVGVPLGYETCGWTPLASGRRRVAFNDVKVEDPYAIVVGHTDYIFEPAFGINPAVPEMKENFGKILAFINKVLVDHIRRGRHVIWVLPSLTDVIEEPQMKEVKTMVEDGSLIVIFIGSNRACLVTTMLVAESMFDPRHTAQGEQKIDHSIFEMIVQQASVEQEAVQVTQEAFPTTFRMRNPKRTRLGRTAVIARPLGSEPPVYLRAQAPDPTRPDDEVDRTLAELIGEETPAYDLPVAGQGDDASHRAIMAQQLDPILSLSEADRRKNWIRLRPELRKCLRDLHVNFGHPTNVTLQRILRRQGARSDAIRGVDFLACDACGESIRRKRPKPVRLPSKYEFNNHLMIDVFYSKDIRGVMFSFLNILCDATGFQVVSCLGNATGPPASSVVLRHFLTAWSSWAGLPNSLQVDRGKEFLAKFSDHLKRFGVEQETMPLEAPWKQGKVERAGGLWKEIFQKTVQEMQVSGISDVTMATSIVTQTRNSFPKSSGYTPNQWVLGRPEVRLPGSLLIDEEAERLEVLEAAEDPTSAMARSLGMREAARVAQVKLDTDGRVRRALLRQSTPTRGPYPVGSYVYFYRVQAPPGETRPYRWHGPARVIGIEARNQRRAHDQDIATDGGQPHAYWLRYGPSVVLVSGEQLRFASEDELLAAHMVPQEVLAPPYARGARGFVDLRPPQSGPSLQSGAAAAQGSTASTSSTATFPAPASSSVIPGTEIPVMPGLLPPVPEGDEGGLLDEIVPGQPPTQRPRVDGDPVAQARTGEQQQQQPQPGAAPQEPPPDVTRQTSEMSAEPEPQPTPPAAPAVPPAVPPVIANNNIFARPNQLDGYNPARATRRGSAEMPYLFEEEIWEPASLTRTVRDTRLRRMVGDIEEYEFDTEDEESETEDSAFYMCPADIFLTGKAVKSEVKLQSLSCEDREKFDRSMAKEWDSWQKFNAVEKLSPEQITDLPKDVKIIGARWVHTDKNAKPRLLALYLARRTGKSKSQIEKDYPFEAKSRLVAQGCQEDQQSIRSDSPTASLLSFNFVCAVAVLKGWTITACDASTAYLQSQGISRLLILRPPRPPPPGLSPHDLLRAKGSIYGTRDAGRSWWRKLYRTLRKYQWKMSSIEPALFFFANSRGDLEGILLTHVDDLYSAGEGEDYHGTLKELEKELHLKIKHESFRFCGKNIVQKEGGIEVDQYDAIEGIDYMLLETERRKVPGSPLTEAEKSAFRGLIGQMGWVTRQSRPDLMVNVSMASQSMGNPTVRDVINLNKAVKLLKDTSEAKWCFRPSKLKIENCVVFCFADSSFANVEGGKSQCGYVVGLTSKEILGGDTTPIYVLETYSGSIKRVCRSTLAAEANGFLAGVEAGEFLRTLLMEAIHPTVPLYDLDVHYLKEKIISFTDARSLEQTLNKDAGQPQDKRVRILLAQVKDFLGENSFEDDAPAYATWVDTSRMLADVLTKLGCDRDPLLSAIHDGTWCLRPSHEARQKKLLVQAGRHARKAKKNQEREA